MEKNKFKTAIEKCQNLLKFFTEKQVEKFEAVKVLDSEDLVDYGAELVVGAEVSVSSSTGSVTAPDGEYKLVNGAVFTVKDGKVEAISKEIDAPVENAELAEDAAVSTEDVAVEDKPSEPVKSEEVKALEEKVSKLEEMVKSIMDLLPMMPAKEDVEDFNSKVEALSKVPTQLSANNSVEIKETELEKFTRIANSFKK